MLYPFIENRREKRACKGNHSERLGENDYLAEYNGVKCHAIFNPIVGRYYVDDVYGVIRNKPPERDSR